MIRAVICDFGGVLTTPLLRSFMAFQDQTGISGESLGKAMLRILEREGAHPLHELEKGNTTEGEYLAKVAAELREELDHTPEMVSFSAIFFDALDPNEPMIETMRQAKAAGYRMAMLTNNVREWEPVWRAMLPVDEIFELVVDSAFVGMRKPEPEIYQLTLARLREHDGDRLGDLKFGECLFIDDLEVNCVAARELGMEAIQFESNERALPAIRAKLGVTEPVETVTPGS
ncbi:MAG: HAD family phosphatase [Actinomycetota bacterium]|nr:HAD family phosphatase [Actinomycetota bacterium]